MFNTELLMCYHLPHHQKQILPTNINGIIS